MLALMHECVPDLGRSRVIWSDLGVFSHSGHLGCRCRLPSRPSLPPPVQREHVSGDFVSQFRKRIGGGQLPAFPCRPYRPCRPCRRPSACRPSRPSLPSRAASHRRGRRRAVAHHPCPCLPRKGSGRRDETEGAGGRRLRLVRSASGAAAGYCCWCGDWVMVARTEVIGRRLPERRGASHAKVIVGGGRVTEGRGTLHAKRIRWRRRRLAQSEFVLHV